MPYFLPRDKVKPVKHASEIGVTASLKDFKRTTYVHRKFTDVKETTFHG